MILIIEMILILNHYGIFILKRGNINRVRLNQIIVYILFLFLFIQVYVVTNLAMSTNRVIYSILYNLGLIFCYVLIACAELILALNNFEIDKILKYNNFDSAWYILTIAISVFTATIFEVIHNVPLYFWIPVIIILILQVVGLIFSLNVDIGSIKNIFTKIIRILLKVSIVCVIGLFAFAVFALSNEFHNLVKATDKNENIINSYVEETDDLYIIYPKYNKLEFVLKDRPDINDDNITFCSGGTFQKTYNFDFDYNEIPGQYVVNGVIYDGYAKDGLGAFSYYNGQYHFANSDEVEKEVMNASKNGGFLLRQYLVIDDGEVISEPCKKLKCYRFLAEIDGRLCIIDSKTPGKLRDFTEQVLKLGAKHALYMDMGNGWNYSWYRDNKGSAQILIGKPWIFSHNWLIFKK